MSRQIKYRQSYEQEIKGKASTDAGMAEAVHAKENSENFSQVRDGAWQENFVSSSLSNLTFWVFLIYDLIMSKTLKFVFTL